MENETTVETDSQAAPIETEALNVSVNDCPSGQSPTKAKVLFEQVELFELDADEARDMEYLRKLLEPHYSAATDAKFEYHEEGEWLVVTMIKQNPPKG